MIWIWKGSTTFLYEASGLAESQDSVDEVFDISPFWRTETNRSAVLCEERPVTQKQTHNTENENLELNLFEWFCQEGFAGLVVYGQKLPILSHT